MIDTYGLKKTKADEASSSMSSSIKERTTPKKEKLKGAKLRNFTKEEDLLLSRAYVRVSLDPIRGNDQKSQDFWTHVFRTVVTFVQFPQVK